MSETFATHQTLLDSDPAQVHQMHLAAIEAAQAGQLDRALALFDQVLAHAPSLYAAWSNRGNVLDNLGRAQEALESFDRALALVPDYESALHNRAVVTQKMGNDAFNRGIALEQDGDLAGALACYEEALAIHPAHQAANLQAGLTLEELGREREAADRFIHSAEIDPGYTDGLHRAAIILATDLNLHAEALQYYNQYLAAHPSDPWARWHRSQSLLALGHYREGWQEYNEVSFEPGHNPMGRMSPLHPRWRGEPIDGLRIVLWCEQGYGDALQFCRYATLVKSLGAQVFLLTAPKLERLFKTVFEPQGIPIILGSSQASPYHYQCSLMALPLACATDSVEKIPNQVPYLWPDEHDAQQWQRRVQQALPGEPDNGRERGNTCRVGLVWAGGHRPDNPGAQAVDRLRSLHLCEFAPLRKVSEQAHVSFFNLQIGESALQLAQLQSQGWDGPDLIDLTADVRDWADTAALVASLDLVIACDTATAHLAAAMGKPTWILSRYSGCWRWLQDRDDSPWYPSVRLFRQVQPGDWGEVMERVVQALSEFCAPWKRASPSIKASIKKEIKKES